MATTYTPARVLQHQIRVAERWSNILIIGGLVALLGGITYGGVQLDYLERQLAAHQSVQRPSSLTVGHLQQKLQRANERVEEVEQARVEAEQAKRKAEEFAADLAKQPNSDAGSTIDFLHDQLRKAQADADAANTRVREAMKRLEESEVARAAVLQSAAATKQELDRSSQAAGKERAQAATRIDSLQAELQKTLSRVKETEASRDAAIEQAATAERAHDDAIHEVRKVRAAAETEIEGLRQQLQQAVAQAKEAEEARAAPVAPCPPAGKTRQGIDVYIPPKEEPQPPQL